MPKFSRVSASRLETAHPDLQRLFNKVVEYYDCVVVCGARSKEEQDAAVAAGNSTTPWPKSKHNRVPSLAVDVSPYDRPAAPIDWNDRERMTLFAGFVIGTAALMGISIRWGGDWDRDTYTKDNSFDDLVHFELID
jgi:hypothetical protein